MNPPRRKYARAIPDGTTRMCTKCGKEKPLDKFRPKIRGLYGRCSWCRKCESSHNCAHLKANTERYKHTLELQRQWIKNNPEKYRQIQKRNKSKILNTPKGRLNSRISSLMNKSIKGGKQGSRWESLAGYTINDLKKHLEKHFLPGMSWGNIGKWHIDHIIPRSAYNYKSTNDIDFKRCWALNNLQPLWAEDNQKKKDILNHPFQPSLTIAV